MPQFHWLLNTLRIFGFLIILSSPVLATSRSSYEGSVAIQIKVAIQVFVHEHNNNLPSSWQELESFAPLEKVNNLPLSEYYSWINNAPPSEEMRGAQVLAMSRNPAPELDREGTGHFVIVRSEKGDIESRWYPEDRIQKIIAQTQISVPPQTAPPFPKSAHLAASETNPDLHYNENPASNSAQVTSPAPITPPPSDVISNTPTSVTPASAVPPQIPKTVAEVPTSETGIPLWVYGIVMLSVGLIGGVWYFFLREKK